MTKATATATEVQSPDAVRPLRADARRNRQAVIDAASKLFADRGLDAQMPDVARAANVGVGTVYRHFQTKDHLIAAIASQHFERIAERGREDLELPDPWEGICDFIRFAIQLQADDRGLCEIMSSRRSDGHRRACGRVARAVRQARQTRAAVGSAAIRSRLGRRSDDRLRHRTHHPSRSAAQRRPLAPAGRADPRRSTSAPERVAPPAALTRASWHRNESARPRNRSGSSACCQSHDQLLLSNSDRSSRSAPTRHGRSGECPVVRRRTTGARCGWLLIAPSGNRALNPPPLGHTAVARHR